MNLKAKIKEELRRHYGEFETILEHQYEDAIIEKLVVGPIEKRRAWATYNQIILEIKHSLKDNIKLKELLYKVSDQENPNDIIIEAIEDIKTFTPELERLYYKIRNFKD